MNMLGLNRKVWLTNNVKTDGRYNKGKIVGVEKTYEGLGFITENQYLNDFVPYRYKVAYVDCVTGRASAIWVHHSHVSTTKPVK